MILLLLFSLVGCLSAQPVESPDGPEHVKIYLTLEEALALSFPKADTVWSETWRPTQLERTRIERRLGWRLADSRFTIYRGSRGDEDQGYAIVSNEIGLYKPITFMVKIGPGKDVGPGKDAGANKKVQSVHVMVFRESRGGVVRRRRFLVQYQGKSIGSPIRINRDIIGVTGATLSVRAMNAGVKKALAIVETAYPANKGDQGGDT